MRSSTLSYNNLFYLFIHLSLLLAAGQAGRAGKFLGLIPIFGAKVQRDEWCLCTRIALHKWHGDTTA